MRQFVFLIVVILTGSVSAQDPNFSQFYNNPIYYNSAMTAINNGMSFRLNARNLWGPIPGRFNTFSTSLEAQTVYKMGLGINAYSDVGGEALLRTSGAYLNYSYRPIDTKNFILQAGIAGGFVQKSIDWSKLTFSDQLDESLGNINQSAFNRPNYNTTSYADFQTGIVMRFNGDSRKQRGAFKRYSMTFGGSIHHLSQPKDVFLGDDITLPIKYVGHFSSNFLFNNIIIQPGFVVEKQNEFRTFSFGANIVNKPFTIGLWTRNRTAVLSGKQFDSFIAVIGINLPDKGNMTWKVMYNFDFTVSRLKTSSYGSHELTLVMDFNDRVLFKGKANAKSIRRRYQCPKDFSGYQ